MIYLPRYWLKIYKFLNSLHIYLLKNSIWEISKKKILKSFF